MSTEATDPPTGEESDAGQDAGASTDSPAEGNAGKSRFRDPEKARQAANARWAKHREAQTPPEPGQASVDGKVAVMSVAVRIGTVIRALEKEAAKGNANAARELRGWLAEYPPDDTDLSVEKLDKVMRQRALAYVLARLAEEDAAKDEEA